MSGAIVVPLDEMQQLAGLWQTTIGEMDTMVQQIARDIANIPDNAKGLNEVRSRGRTVGSQHRQTFDRGTVVYQHVTASVQRFAQADHQLAGMVRSMQGQSVLQLIRELNGVYQISVAQINHTQAIIVDNSDGYLDWGLTATDTFIEFANLKGWILESGGELASRILTYADIIKDTGAGLKAGLIDGNIDLALHHFAGAASIAQLAYGSTLISGGLVAAGFSAAAAGAIAFAIPVALQTSSWGIGLLQDNLRNTSGLEVYANTLEPIRQITDLKGVFTEINKAVWLNRQKDWLQGGWQGFTNGIARDWTDFTQNIIPNKAQEIYQDRIEARQKTIDLIMSNDLLKGRVSQAQVEQFMNVFPMATSAIPGSGVMSQVFGLGPDFSSMFAPTAKPPILGTPPTIPPPADPPIQTMPMPRNPPWPDGIPGLPPFPIPWPENGSGIPGVPPFPSPWPEKNSGGW